MTPMTAPSDAARTTSAPSSGSELAWDIGNRRFSLEGDQDHLSVATTGVAGSGDPRQTRQAIVVNIHQSRIAHREHRGTGRPTKRCQSDEVRGSMRRQQRLRAPVRRPRTLDGTSGCGGSATPGASRSSLHGLVDRPYERRIKVQLLRERVQLHHSCDGGRSSMARRRASRPGQTDVTIGSLDPAAEPRPSLRQQRPATRLSPVGDSRPCGSRRCSCAQHSPSHHVLVPEQAPASSSAQRRRHLAVDAGKPGLPPPAPGP